MNGQLPVIQYLDLRSTFTSHHWNLQSDSRKTYLFKCFVVDIGTNVVSGTGHIIIDSWFPSILFGKRVYKGAKRLANFTCFNRGRLGPFISGRRAKVDIWNSFKLKLSSVFAVMSGNSLSWDNRNTGWFDWLIFSGTPWVFNSNTHCLDLCSDDECWNGWSPQRIPGVYQQSVYQQSVYQQGVYQWVCIRRVCISGCVSVGVYPCRCPSGFMGMRCEHADLLAVVASHQRGQTVATLLVLCVMGCALTMLFCTLLQ